MHPMSDELEALAANIKAANARLVAIRKRMEGLPPERVVALSDELKAAGTEVERAVQAATDAVDAADDSELAAARLKELMTR
jgi:hypothetical protein